MQRERTKSQLIEQTFLSGECCCSPHSTAICLFVIQVFGGTSVAPWRQHTRRRRARHNSVYIAIKTQLLSDF